MSTTAKPAPTAVAYLVPGGPPIHEIMRAEMPPALYLLTPDTGRRDDVLAALSEAEFVIAVKMDAALIAAAPRLRLIQLAGVGHDGVDLGAATARRIPVAQTVEGTIVGVAEHTLLMILAVFKRLCEADASVRRGEWLVWQLRPTSYTLAGKRVGIVGFGRIGREVARRCRAFETEIGYYDPFPARPEIERELGARRLGLDQLLGWADVVSLHLPLSPETRGLIGARELGLMKPTGVLVNTARGGLVDEEALARALAQGRLGGAGLDVFAAEPPDRAHPLFGLASTVLSPHIATGTRDSVAEKTRAACANFLRVLQGEPPANVVNPEALAADRPPDPRPART